MDSLLDSLRKDLDAAIANDAYAHEQYKEARRAYARSRKDKKNILNAVQVLEK